MAKVWTYDEMKSGTAQQSADFDATVDLYEHPQYGPIKVPQMDDLFPTEADMASWAQWYDAQGFNKGKEVAGQYPYAYRPTQEEQYQYRLEYPKYLPSPEELERARQIRIAGQAQGRRRTRLASMAEGSRSASPGVLAQLGSAPRSDLLGESSPQLGARTLLSGLS